VCCSVLQCTAVWGQSACAFHVVGRHTATHCNILQHTATRCNTLQHTTHWIELQYTATSCSTLQHAATHCSTLQHTATRLWPLDHELNADSGAERCSGGAKRRSDGADEARAHPTWWADTLQHTATRCNTLQHTCGSKTTNSTRRWCLRDTARQNI